MARLGAWRTRTWARLMYAAADFRAGLNAGYDFRPVMKAPRGKYAVRRGNALHLVECPRCHTQAVVPWRGAEATGVPLFECRRKGCETFFTLYLEDGLVRLRELRAGNARLPYRAVINGNDKAIELGAERVAPASWHRMVVYRDLRPDGKDAHGHNPYEVKERPPERPPSGRA